MTAHRYCDKYRVKNMSNFSFKGLNDDLAIEFLIEINSLENVSVADAFDVVSKKLLSKITDIFLLMDELDNDMDESIVRTTFSFRRNFLDPTEIFCRNFVANDSTKTTKQLGETILETYIKTLETTKAVAILGITPGEWSPFDRAITWEERADMARVKFEELDKVYSADPVNHDVDIIRIDIAIEVIESHVERKKKDKRRT